MKGKNHQALNTKKIQKVTITTDIVLVHVCFFILISEKIAYEMNLSGFDNGIEKKKQREREREKL